MQLALSKRHGTSIALKKGVHQSLTYFKWLLDNLSKRPTQIAELIPLLPSALGHHDALKVGACGLWVPTDQLVPRAGYHHRPVVWRHQWPKHIQDSLVTTYNPTGTIKNSDLELAGKLLHLQAVCQAYDVRAWTLLSKTDNLATLFWQRKGSPTTDKCPRYLLRLFGIHQCYHRYVPRHAYLPGPSNPIENDSSRLFHLSYKQFLQYMSSNYKHPKPYLLLPLEPAVISDVISALLMKP